MTTADFLISKSLSEESRSSYKNIFLTYKQFLQNHVDKAANPLVPKLSHLVAYIAHCFTQGLAASTTRTHISALSFIFQLGGHQDLTQHFIIKKQNLRRMQDWLLLPLSCQKSYYPFPM